MSHEHLPPQQDHLVGGKRLRAALVVAEDWDEAPFGYPYMAERSAAKELRQS